MGTAHDYLGAILQRSRVPMEPAGFEPDWRDRPRYAKYYPDAERIALPTRAPAGVPPGMFSVPLLADMLRHSYGYLGRRLAPQANHDLAGLPNYPQANWWRGTASGGGLYPVSVYWAAGAGGGVLPGLFHYSPSHHEMRRLLTGDVTAEVRAALGDWPEAATTDQYLILGVKFWQNAFKYNSFSYHAVTMDVGTILHTWRTIAGEHGLSLRPLLWFDDERLGALLGTRPEQEGVFAVVPLPWTAPGLVPAADAAHPPRVRHADRERSRRVLTFDAVTALHRATIAGGASRPAPAALKGAGVSPPAAGRPAADLPAPRPAARPARQALRARRSSFGRFCASEPTTAAELGAVLAAAHEAASFGCDVTEPGNGLDLAKLYVFASHVRGIAPGAYEFDPAGHRLLRISEGDPGAFLQRTYFLQNYNLEQAGAVIVPALRAAAVLDAVGDRGYRLANAVAGAIAQATYTAAAAAGIGCGAALGFDNLAYAEELGLGGTGEAPLLIMMIGRERARPGDYHYQIG